MKHRNWYFVLAPALLPVLAALGQAQSPGLNASQLGLLINDNDPFSVAVGSYYKSKRAIPDANIVHVRLPYTASVPDGKNPWGQEAYNTVRDLTQSQFQTLKTQVDGALSAQVQAIAVAWMNPSRIVWSADYGQPQHIDSITSALARGLLTGAYVPATGRAFCEGNGVPSPYYNSASSRPFTDFQMRPAMLLAAYTVAQAKALIDRGVASDGTRPHGKAHILYTTDSLRNARARAFQALNAGYSLSPYVSLQLDGSAAAPVDALSGTTDTLFYFAGSAHVGKMTTNTFPPGAIGDTLTSTSGVLPDGLGQVPALDWIAAGETGTYGTVAEPCDFDGPVPFVHKFPDPAILIPHYTSGETLIEAYWKSVAQTFQGLWIGEPLARPWSARTPLVLNAATYAAGPVAPGEIVTVWGEDLSGSVSFDGVAAPVLYTSPSQINAVVPYEVAGNSTTTVQIGNAAPITLSVAASSPGIFAAVNNHDGTATLYGTGAGQTNPAGLDGAIATDPFPVPQLDTSVTVDGQPAQILYAGAAPAEISGVLQVNFTFSGSTGAVVLKVGDNSSAPVQIQ